MEEEENSAHAALARKAVEEYVSSRRVADASEAPEELTGGRAGAFVCLKIDGDLRGCIGTIEPVTDNLAKEIVRNAISSATQDPRFMPVGPGELSRLTYSVDVLGEPEAIDDIGELDPGVYGVIVTSGGRSGLLLPDLEGVDTAEDQVRIASMKAGIRPGEPVALQRFKVTRHK